MTSNQRFALGLVAFVGVAVVIVVAAGGGGDSSSTSGNDGRSMQQTFVESCSADGTMTASECRCSWNEIKDYYGSTDEMFDAFERGDAEWRQAQTAALISCGAD